MTKSVLSSAWISLILSCVRAQRWQNTRDEPPEFVAGRALECPTCYGCGLDSWILLPEPVLMVSG